MLGGEGFRLVQGFAGDHDDLKRRAFARPVIDQFADVVGGLPLESRFDLGAALGGIGAGGGDFQILDLGIRDDEFGRDACGFQRLGLDQIGKRAFAQPIHGVSGAQAILLHPHVQVRVRLEREAATGLVKLEGRDAEVEENAVEIRHRQVGEAAEILARAHQVQQPDEQCYADRDQRQRAAF